MRRVLVTGGDGQLARALRATWHDADSISLDRAALDLGSTEGPDAAIDRYRPSVVVNAGAMTDVDACEADPARAHLVNALGVARLARACARGGALLIQISTDYVFEGEGEAPLHEGDPTAPQTVYGESKLAGERAATIAPEHLILRTAWLFGGGGPRDFRATMLRLARRGEPISVVDDQRGSPTSVFALARHVRASVERGLRGLHHATCAGHASRFELARAIFEEAGVIANLRPVSSRERPSAAPRPRATVLDNARRLAAGPDVMGHFRDALAELPKEP